MTPPFILEVFHNGKFYAEVDVHKVLPNSDFSTRESRLKYLQIYTAVMKEFDIGFEVKEKEI